MSDLSDEAKALFSRSRGELTPSEEDLRRVERAVLLGTTAAAAGAASLGVSGSAAAAAGTQVATTAVGSAASAGLKVLLTFAFAAGLGAGGVLTYRLTEPPVQLVAPSAPPARQAASARSAAPALVPRSADSAPPRERAEGDRAVSDAPAKRAAPKSLPDSGGSKPLPSTEPPGVQRGAAVAEEARLLRDADRALRSGDAEAALALLEQHERAHPGGTLVEERAAERVFALCAGGRLTEARSAAARFLEQYPRSPLAERVRATCAGPTPTR
jgi:hypothetical protein